MEIRNTKILEFFRAFADVYDLKQKIHNFIKNLLDLFPKIKL